VIQERGITLDLPSMDIFPSYIEALHEDFQRGIQEIKTKEQIAKIEADPEAHLHEINDQSGMVELANGEFVKKVPYENLWLAEGKTFIGEVSFRHELNENLKVHGGHVGYGIRPSMRNKGYGTLALKLTKERASRMGMGRLLLTCSPDNPASEKIIVNNGGIYLDTQPNPFGFGPTKRFWITIE
jgi:predicted acetyltransferase